jgi:hypothetical protein
MRSIWDKYYSDAHGVVFVLDAADVTRFEEAKLAFGQCVGLCCVDRHVGMEVDNCVHVCLWVGVS